MARGGGVTYREHHHEVCDAPWECKGCGEDVCPRCHPSPAEFDLCADCYWIEDTA